MKNLKTALVLEGGGMRGAYTAGALSWLIDNNIEFSNGYGISTGAVHLCNYIMKRKDLLLSFSTKYITDKRAMFLPAILRCGHIVDYDFLFDKIMIGDLKYDLSPLKDNKTNGQIGVYDLKAGKTVYLSSKDIKIEELKAATSLPLIGKIIKVNDKEYLDGGITEMIPIEQAIKDGCKKHLIITTKPGDFVRKPSSNLVVNIMKLVYHKFPSVGNDYKVRHLNYNKEIDLIKNLEANKDAVYIYPSKSSNVTRLGGCEEDLIALYELGRADMEAHKDEIFALVK